MKSDVILNKITSLKRCVERINLKTPNSSKDLLDNLDLQDILSINLERAIQISVDIASHIIANSDHPSPTTMAESFETLNKMGVIDGDLSLRLQKSIGFRNISVHEYDKINWEIVFSICKKHTSDFNKFAKQILKILD